MTEAFNWKRYLESDAYKKRCLESLKKDLLPELAGRVADMDIREEVVLTSQLAMLGNICYRNQRGDVVSVKIDTYLRELSNKIGLLIESLGGNIVPNKYDNEEFGEIIDLDELE